MCVCVTSPHTPPSVWLSQTQQKQRGCQSHTGACLTWFYLKQGSGVGQGPHTTSCCIQEYAEYLINPRFFPFLSPCKLVWCHLSLPKYGSNPLTVERMDGMTDPQKWRQNISIAPWGLAAVQSCPLQVSGWDMNQTKKSKCTSPKFFTKMVSVILGRSYNVDDCWSAHFSDQFVYNELFDDIKRVSVTSDWVGRVYGWDIDTAAPPPDHYYADFGSKWHHQRTGAAPGGG